MSHSQSPDESQEQLMTSSYHEINDVIADSSGKSFEGPPSLEQLDQKARKLFDKARHWVGDLSLEGIVTHEGQQVTYVAQDIGTKIRLASPTPPLEVSSHPFEYQRTISIEKSNVNKDKAGVASSSISDDVNIVLNEIELEAKKLASSVDSLTENLTGILHSLSSMTVDCTFVASDGVTQLCDTADAAIKVMYQVMAKSEELNRSVQPIYRVHQQIKETKRLLDQVEAEMS